MMQFVSGPYAILALLKRTETRVCFQYTYNENDF